MKTKTHIPTLLKECQYRINYNPLTGEFTWKHNYCKSKIGQPLGAISHGYMAVSVTINKKRNNYLLHRIAWLMTYGYWPTYLDHINQVKTDNRIINLRECTASQNNANRGPNLNSSTGLRGVYPSWCKGYIAKIYHNGKNHHIGMFLDKFEAAKAYDERMIELHGKFAKTNKSLGLIPSET